MKAGHVLSYCCMSVNGQSNIITCIHTLVICLEAETYRDIISLVCMWPVLDIYVCMGPVLEIVVCMGPV